MDVNSFSILKSSNFHIPPNYLFNKDEFLCNLEKLHIGSWRDEYVDHCVLDGTLWELKIYFNNGLEPVAIYGLNAYPDNFKDFADLMGAEFDFEEDDED